MKTQKELEKGCGNDYCGKLIYHKDKNIEDTLCPTCKALLQQNKEFIEIIDKFDFRNCIYSEDKEFEEDIATKLKSSIIGSGEKK